MATRRNDDLVELHAGPHNDQVDPARDLERLAANLGRLIRHWGIRNAARFSGMSLETIRLMANGERTPNTQTLAYLARSCGMAPGDLWLEPDEFGELLRARRAAGELRPFFALRTSRATSSRRSSAASTADADRMSADSPKRSWLHSGAAA